MKGDADTHGRRGMIRKTLRSLVGFAGPPIF